MANGQTPLPPGLAQILERVPDHLGEIALVTVAAIAKAVDSYNARRDTSRKGRRAGDVDTAALVRTLSSLEKRMEEQTGEIHTLGLNVRLLEAELLKLKA